MKSICAYYTVFVSNFIRFSCIHQGHEHIKGPDSDEGGNSPNEKERGEGDT